MPATLTGTDSYPPTTTGLPDPPAPPLQASASGVHVLSEILGLASASTMRLRQAKAWSVVRRRAHCSSKVRSLSVRVSAAIGGPRRAALSSSLLFS
jgi:hypothetical protein